MREILFRGKMTYGGEWSYGNLKVSLKGTAIITPDETVLGKYGQVDPETVGQYTGVDDKNGTKIDVCKSTNLKCIKCNPGACENRKVDE